MRIDTATYMGIHGTQSPEYAKRDATRFVISAAFVAGAAALGIIASVVAKLEAQILIASFAMTLFLMGCVGMVSSRSRILELYGLRLGPLFFGYASIAFGVASLTSLSSEWSNPRIATSAVPTILAVLAVGFLLTALGYQFKQLAMLVGLPLRTASIALMRSRAQEPRPVTWLYVLFAVGNVADLVILIVAGTYGYLGDVSLVTVDTASWYTQPLKILSSLKFAALFGIALIAFRANGRCSFWILFPALAVALPLALLTGMKESYIDVAVAVLIPWVFVKGRIRLTPVLVAAGIFILVVTPVVNQLRNDVRGTETLNAAQALGKGMGELVSRDGYLSNVDPTDTTLQILSRIRQVDNIVIITEKTPSIIPYRDASEILTAPLSGLIPRAIWRDKPVRLSGYEFYKSYYLGEGQSSSAITPQGSLYMHGGFPILFFGMLVIGIALRAYDEALDAERNVHAALLLLYVGPTVIKQELDVPSFLASLPIFAISWILAVYLIFPRNMKS